MKNGLPPNSTAVRALRCIAWSEKVIKGASINLIFEFRYYIEYRLQHESYNSVI